MRLTVFFHRLSRRLRSRWDLIGPGERLYFGRLGGEGIFEAFHCGMVDALSATRPAEVLTFSEKIFEVPSGLILWVFQHGGAGRSEKLQRVGQRQMLFSVSIAGWKASQQQSSLNEPLRSKHSRVFPRGTSLQLEKKKKKKNSSSRQHTVPLYSTFQCSAVQFALHRKQSGANNLSLHAGRHRDASEERQQQPPPAFIRISWRR